MKNTQKTVKILTFVLVIVMLAMLVMQFQPFWSTEGDEASLAGYIWFPKEHRTLTKYFKNLYANDFNLVFKMNNIFPVPVMVFACCVLGVLVCLWKLGHWYSFLIPMLGGFYGAQGYLSQRIFQLGQNWQIHLTLCVLILLLGVAGLVFSLLPMLKKSKKENTAN